MRLSGRFSSEKEVLQKDRDGWKNGPWTGFYGDGDDKHFFHLTLRFHKNGTLEGHGNDAAGKMKVKDGTFTMHANPNTFLLRLRWENKNEITFTGSLGQNGDVSGTFTTADGESGSFFMQPSFGGNAAGGAHLAPAVEPPMQPAIFTPVQYAPSMVSHTSPQPEFIPSSSAIETLVEMGFDRSIARQAVEVAGTLEAQVEWLSQNPNGIPEPQAPIYTQPRAPRVQRRPPSPPPQQFEPAPDCVAMLMSMGFTTEEATMALMMHDNDLERAVAWIFEQKEQRDHRPNQPTRPAQAPVTPPQLTQPKRRSSFDDLFAQPEPAAPAPAFPQPTATRSGLVVEPDNSALDDLFSAPATVSPSPSLGSVASTPAPAVSAVDDFFAPTVVATHQAQADVKPPTRTAPPPPKRAAPPPPVHSDFP
eukprot:TRINITY_DN27889_c0_g1_i1.p2 TRINITY_DN27889_c0_g1~~TRINITY_DN27889_c0_g1_i1.p2  ORF type:complete len:419 (-),score=46.41 TRINITY_DN27889_c0_g1_i1:61-1317(-)